MISLPELKPLMGAAGFEDVHQMTAKKIAVGHSEQLPGFLICTQEKFYG